MQVPVPGNLEVKSAFQNKPVRVTVNLNGALALALRLGESPSPGESGFASDSESDSDSDSHCPSHGHGRRTGPGPGASESESSESPGPSRSPISTSSLNLKLLKSDVGGGGDSAPPRRAPIRMPESGTLPRPVPCTHCQRLGLSLRGGPAGRHPGPAGKPLESRVGLRLSRAST